MAWGNPQAPPSCSTLGEGPSIASLHLCTRLTVDNEVDLSGVRLVAGLEGAGVEALVPEPHLGDEDGELLWRVDKQPHSGVAGPAVVAGIQDVGAVQPGHAGHVLVDEAAGEGEVQVRVRVTPSGPTAALGGRLLWTLCW